VRRLVPGVAHDADPARASRERVPQLDAKLCPMMIGDDDVGPISREAAEPVCQLEAVGQGLFRPLRIRLDEHRPVTRIRGVAQQVGRYRRGEDGHQHSVFGRRRGGPVGDRAAVIVDVPGRTVRRVPVVVLPVLVVVLLMLVRRTRHAYELAIRSAAGQPPPRRAAR